MVRISFKKLHNLIASIDYLYWGDTSNSIIKKLQFIVENSNVKNIYEAGIASITKDKYKDIFCNLSELQYLIKYKEDKNNYEIIDLQDPDEMLFEEIRIMLIEKCKINKESKIYITSKKSKNNKLLKYENLSTELKAILDKQVNEINKDF